MARTGLTLDQSDKGYRYNRDSFLLADFAKLKPGARLLDVGAGVGVVSILLGKLDETLNVTALEIDPELAGWAKENAKQSDMKTYNVVIGDFCDVLKMFRPGFFDVVVSNPPYRKKGSGRINPDRVKATARHELKMNLGDLVERSGALLTDGGALVITMIAERRMEYLELIANSCLSETRYRYVHSFEKDAPILFLSEAIKSVGDVTTVVEAPLALKETESGGDSAAYKKIETRFIGG